MTKYHKRKKKYTKFGKNDFLIIFLKFYQGYFCHFRHEMGYCNPNDRWRGHCKFIGS
jgi:hypothetical protein